jgi:2-polyprenyl-6-methoxyphenol hydroxylase-like FAD-dependent oxidoreductase
MPDIGIVGAGTAGLHLALYLQQQGLEPTLYAERTPDEMRAGRLPNTVAHHHRTRSRERALGVNHWDGSGPSYARHCHFFGGEQPLRFPGDFTAPSLAVDYRLYQPRLLEDFEERGGGVETGAISADDLPRLASRHDLIVVGTGRGGLTELFPPVPGRSPFDRPQRLLSAGLYTGIAYNDPNCVTFAVSPGHGELIEIPLETFEGNAMTLLFENIPGGDLGVLGTTPYDDDPKAYEALVLEKLREHYPPVFERVDASSFGLTRPSSILQGAVTPTVRETYADIDGTTAIAVGDAHVVVDPVVGQGANSASFSAWTLGEAILEGGPFDEAFCRKVDERRLPFVLGVFDWTAAMLGPPPPHMFELIGAMSQNKALCDDFTENFNNPDLQWEHIRSPGATAAYISAFS